MSNRREFIKKIGIGLSLLLSANFLSFKKAYGTYKPKVVIIGGGFGGASCLKYLSNFSENIDITMVEKKSKIQTCPFSNLVIGGAMEYSKIVFNPKNFMKQNIKFVNEFVNYINPKKKIINFNNNLFLEYDFLILSPGIGFKWEKIIGYNKDDIKKIPHCWDGNKNILEFIKKLKDLENNSKIIITAPDYPYRCPPAPYERASLIANFMKKEGKKFKIFILDSKDSFTKDKLFFSEWSLNYPNLIEWVSRKNGGLVESVDLKSKLVKTKTGLKFKGDFIHVIPEQRASDLISDSGLINQDWCEVNPIDFELIGHKDIFVLGDSINAWAMPKSAFSANSQAKILSANLINKILGKELINPVFLNTCYSFSSDNRAFSISSWYRLNSNKDRIVSLGTIESDINSSNLERIKESREAYGWYRTITKEIYG